MCHCCCASPKQMGVYLIVSVWAQLLSCLGIVTKTAFFTEKGVNEWSYVTFLAYLFLGIVISSYTILWGIQTIWKHGPAKITTIKRVSVLCTAVSLLIFTIIYNYNKRVLLYTETEVVFEIASFFLYFGITLFLVVLGIDHPYQPVNESANVSGHKLIGLLWILFVAGVCLGAAWSYLYFGSIWYNGLLVGSAVQVTALVGMCIFICKTMQKNVSIIIQLGRVNQALLRAVPFLLSMFYGLYALQYVIWNEVYEGAGVLTICYMIISTLYAYLILYMDIGRRNCLECNILPPVADCEEGRDSAVGATVRLEDVGVL